MQQPAYLNAILELDKSIDTLLQNRIILPALILIYATIDILGWLNSEDEFSSRKTFIDWVEKYLIIDERLDCSALDLYSARCGLIHTYNPITKLSKRGVSKQIAYAWGNCNIADITKFKNDSNKESFAEVHINELHDAIRKGTVLFLHDISQNKELCEKVEGKAKNFFINFSATNMNILNMTIGT